MRRAASATTSLVGNTANNILDGGAGSDTVIFTNTTGITVPLNDTNADVIVSHDGETDTLRSIENIGGTSGNDAIVGNGQANVLVGGSGGADVLVGPRRRRSPDRRRLHHHHDLSGTVAGGHHQGPVHQQRLDRHGGGHDRRLRCRCRPEHRQRKPAVPHATINALRPPAAWSNIIGWTSRSPGAQVVFDIDGTGTLDDSIIELVNGSGTVLATNDTGPGDPGSTVNDDAYITYTSRPRHLLHPRRPILPATGSVAQPLLAGQTYQLNIRSRTRPS